MASCTESIGNSIERTIAGFFRGLGLYVGTNPKRTMLMVIALTILCGVGFMRWETENRGDKLWVPQDTTAEEETNRYEEYFASDARFNTMLIQSSTPKANMLTKDRLLQAMLIHRDMETEQVTIDGVSYDYLDLCVPAGGSCVAGFDGICQCLVTSVLRQWNYDLETLEADENYMQTLAEYGTKADLEAVLGNPVFDDEGVIESAEAISLSYYLSDRSVIVGGDTEDPINEGWEETVFLATADNVGNDYPALSVDYFASRSFNDEFGEAITGDLALVQVSYVMAFLFLGATMGKVRCGTGSRWTMAIGALLTVGLSTAAGFGLSSLFGLFFGPVHSLLPFILLGIGVDDAFVIVNAFNQERKVKRTGEDNSMLASRAARALARAGASITVTSATDLVAFAISSTSALPALASFCAYAAISIFFLWWFASTFFSAALVLDERRQRDNRRECAVCLTRKKPIDEDADDAEKEGLISTYFRKYHAPAILSTPGKVISFVFFSCLLAFGIYGALNLSVEDSERNFIPEGGYLADYFDASDSFFPDRGIDLFITFEGGSDIYDKREAIAALDERLTGLSTSPPYIAEPVSEEAYKNVMAGLASYLAVEGTANIGGAALNDDNWPVSEMDFTTTLMNYTSVEGPGATYSQDVSFNDAGELEAIRIELQYVRLVKDNRGEIIDDAERQIDAMDETRSMVAGWDDLPSAFPYSSKFITIEGFKIISRELFLNVGLALAAVAVIVLFTVASPVTSLLITLNVGFCIVEILGFMFALGIVIDSVSVINMVLAVGLSVDYSAHIGHCFMVKGGDDRDRRALEALADVGAAVLSGAISTFLAVVVLLFSTSYVFAVLSTQFAITVLLGVSHGLIFLPVLLAMFGPKPFEAAEKDDDNDDDDDKMRDTARPNGSDDENQS